MRQVAPPMAATPLDAQQNVFFVHDTEPPHTRASANRSFCDLVNSNRHYQFLL